jgi:hypothetical protein
MTFDLTAFGYGCGLVMMPFIVGMAVSMIINAIKTFGGR